MGHPRARLGAGVLIIAAVIVLGGCRVDTKVSVVDKGGGHGTVLVTATFDAEAVQALGGQAGLARQLSVGDLIVAGWTVNGPIASSDGGATVTIRHGYSSSPEASRLFAELAGSGQASNRPFKLTLSTRRGLFHVRDSLSGRIDLSCGLSCFGDQGLQSALGNANGVSTAPLLQAAGKQPDQIFGFAFTARMPGSLRSDNAATRDRSQLTWSTPLGKNTEISAQSESLNTGNIVLISVLGGIVIIGLGMIAFFHRRRRRRSSRERSSRSKHARGRRIWLFGSRPQARSARGKEKVKARK